MGFQCRMLCERIPDGLLRYSCGNAWCRECSKALMKESLITMNTPTLRCPCCHQRVRFKSRNDGKNWRKLRDRYVDQKPFEELGIKRLKQAMMEGVMEKTKVS
jgi:DNA-directed RNA polymerase subunit RPC12/RpoP